ncbi:MAG: DNA polymerase III subunit alpha [Gemmatimonadota bacterium]|nr:DNA polymerase III subunit alpha [Gemmatimonadota bacterium]MDH3367130.1 DNA polymerase III subunit alpha [Gemmatimonadota bacterium]MDH3476888.1 DNA polymerase III subunit alpha [Gemmatimonadota bacterium]MDH3569104.1 DNA polymerase III subunit alpha [Gemmatimonadota bacterium]
MYIELHCHSAFSFLDGASLPEQLVLQAEALGYPALALTDHNGLYGSMAFAQAAKHLGIGAITGAEVTLLDGTHVTLLVETPRGYANLCRLLTEAHLGRDDRRDPRLDFASLEAHHEGLIVLSGCREGLLPSVLAREGVTAARCFAAHCRAVFGSDHFFVELQRNAVRGDRALTRTLADIADAEHLSVVATGDVHYHHRERHRLHDALVAIRHRTTLDASHHVRRPNSEFFLRRPAEVTALFRDRPDAVANTLHIAERCLAFDLTTDLGYTFPDFHGADRQPAPAALAALCRARLDDRYPPNAPHRREAEQRLDEELRLVERHGLCGFFLVYHDLFELAREVAAEVRLGSRRATGNLLPGRGRGSSVSSIICYFLGLSHIDPVANRLFLGRFLNETLASVPDIDLDFPREIREELIRRVYQRYGDAHTGLVCSFPTYRLRSAVRELGKALDLPQGEIEQVARLAGHHSAGALREQLSQLPGFVDRVKAPLWRDLCALAEEIAGLPRHISQHVGGMIISSRPLVDIVPLERSAMPDRVVCQWDKDSCDDARFIKIDFLALGMLSLVEECVELVAWKEGTPPDLSRIDFEDEHVFDQICSGDTVGLFQIESRAQIQMIRRTRPRNLEDLAVEVAIVRPGPIVGGAVNPYVRRREAQRHARAQGLPYDPPVEHPLLGDALGETLGVIIFQDQVLQVCQALAGFSAGQAEALRRAMSRRRSRELMENFWEEFLEGTRRHSVSEATARKVFEQVVAFSEFGFPKSHAAAFGLLAYQSAWLRHYHAVEYYTALFNNQPMGFYSIDALVRDADRHGVEALLPDIHRSDVYCTVEDGHIRIGLGFLRNWGWDVTEVVVDERLRNGPFRSLGDLVRRAPAALSRDAIEYLVWVGGCDRFGLTRRELLWQVGLWLPPKTESTSRHRTRRQLELPLVHPYERLRFGDVAADERLIAEYEVLGFSTSGHPFTVLRPSLPTTVIRSDQMEILEHGSDVQVAGLVVARQRPETARGYTFILLEDEAGMVNIIVRPQIYERDRVAIRGEPFLWITGTVAKDDGTVNVIAQEVRPLTIGQPRKPAVGKEQWNEAVSPHDKRPVRMATFLKDLRRHAPGSKNWG